MSYRAVLADGLSLGNGSSGVAVALSVFFAAYLASGALSRRGHAKAEMGPEIS